MIAKYALAFLLATSASANPFKPAKTAKKNAAKAKYMNKLTKAAKPTARSQLSRKLNDGDDYIPDISGYSIKFEQCQFVKAYDDEMADNEEAGTVLATKRFVIFRLCPTGSESCNYNYGEYVVDMDVYLEAYVEYAQEQQEEWCQTCEEYCQNGNRRLDDNANNANNYYNYDCSCVDTCYKIENMEENGYIDATELLQCQDIYEDNYGNQLFAGPYCSGGEKIKIGVFSDEECMFLESGKDVESYLQDDDGYSMKLSHALLKKTYDSSDPVSCLVVDEEDQNNNNNNNGDNDNNNNNNNQEEPEVLDLCEQLYEEAAKCEKTHGFDDGYSNYYGYENQLAQEGVVCDFISSLKSGTYTESGEIYVKGGGTIIRGNGEGTTGGQKFALTFFIIGTVGLAVYAAMLHSQLTKGAKADLSKQGGAIA